MAHGCMGDASGRARCCRALAKAQVGRFRVPDDREAPAVSCMTSSSEAATAVQSFFRRPALAPLPACNSRGTLGDAPANLARLMLWRRRHDSSAGSICSERPRARRVVARLPPIAPRGLGHEDRFPPGQGRRARAARPRCGGEPSSRSHRASRGARSDGSAGGSSLLPAGCCPGIVRATPPAGRPGRGRPSRGPPRSPPVSSFAVDLSSASPEDRRRYRPSRCRSHRKRGCRGPCPRRRAPGGREPLATMPWRPPCRDGSRRKRPRPRGSPPAARIDKRRACGCSLGAGGAWLSLASAPGIKTPGLMDDG